MNVNELFVVRPTNEEQNDFIITIGQHLATEKHFPTREEAETYKDTPQWDTVLAMVSEMFIIHEEAEYKADEIRNDAKNVVNTIIENTKKQQK